MLPILLTSLRMCLPIPNTPISPLKAPALTCPLPACPLQEHAVSNPLPTCLLQETTALSPLSLTVPKGLYFPLPSPAHSTSLSSPDSSNHMHTDCLSCAGFCIIMSVLPLPTSGLLGSYTGMSLLLASDGTCIHCPPLVLAGNSTHLHIPHPLRALFL